VIASCAVCATFVDTHNPARISHFFAMSLFALLVSIALAGLTKRTAEERTKYALSCFLKFLAVAIAIGWLMYPFSH
jgi:bacteriorhodopsin